MPADITGTDVLEEDRATGHRTIRFIHGPIFANILLADEINRTPPKTQAALLEAMQEYHVTAGGNEFQLGATLLSSSLHRTRLSKRGRIRYQRHSWTGSCSKSSSTTLQKRKKQISFRRPLGQRYLNSKPHALRARYRSTPQYCEACTLPPTTSCNTP